MPREAGGGEGGGLDPPARAVGRFPTARLFRGRIGVCHHPPVPASHSELWAGPSRFRSLTEAGVVAFLLLCATITVLTTAGIILVLGRRDARVLREVQGRPARLPDRNRAEPRGEPPKFGILPLIWGTFLIAAGSSLIALPIGLLSAIYLSEYAPRRVRGGPQAGAGAAGGHPDDRLRLPRAAAGDPRPEGDLRAAGDPRRDVQRR